MGISTTVQVQGVREAVRSLNKVEPGLRKAFTEQAKVIAAPAVEEAKRGYDQVPLSGMARKWAMQSNGRKVFPYSVARAKSGVKVKVAAGRKDIAIISVAQTNPGAAVYETAGRKTDNRLGRSLGYLANGRTRVVGPAVYRKRTPIAQQMERLVLDVVARVNRELR